MTNGRHVDRTDHQTIKSLFRRHLHSAYDTISVGVELFSPSSDGNRKLANLQTCLLFANSSQTQKPKQPDDLDRKAKWKNVRALRSSFGNHRPGQFCKQQTCLRVCEFTSLRLTSSRATTSQLDASTILPSSHPRASSPVCAPPVPLSCVCHSDCSLHPAASSSASSVSFHGHHHDMCCGNAPIFCQPSYLGTRTVLYRQAHRFPSHSC